jgi:succinoglycan biosynthesis protein ExoA
MKTETIRLAPETVPDAATFVSVVMPVRNEARFIERSLRSVLMQDYPNDRFEVIVADGMSTDGTREIIKQIGDHRNVRVIDNPQQVAATGLNRAIREAKGEVVIRVDGHCEIASDYLRRCVTLLEKGSVECVGGPVETIGETYVSRVIAGAMSSNFGVGGAAFRVGTNAKKFVDTVAFPAYRRDTLRSIGDFDEELVRNQDDEYNYRLRKLGGRILLSPEIHSLYYSRANLRSLATQYFQYGFWKVRVMQKHPRQMRARQFVPAMFILGLLALALTSALVTSGWIALVGYIAGYFLANLIASILVARRSQWTAVALLPVTFLTMHFAYGLGFIVGLIKFWNRWQFSPAAKTVRPAGDVASL